MTRRLARGWAVAAALFLAPLTAAAQEAACAAGAGLLRLEAPLPRVAKALDERQLVVVAVGSSSTAGAGASQPAAAYPAQLEMLLRARPGGASAVVHNLGRNGSDAPDAAGRMAADVLPLRPHLVIWQVGANDAIRSEPPARFAQALRHGVAVLRTAGVDVLLMGPQFAPVVAKAPHLDVYLATLAEVARETQTPLFQRYAIMQATPAHAALVGPDGLHLTDQGYRCLAVQVALAIDLAVTPQQTAAQDR